MKITLLTGGGDRPYSLGLLSCLLSKDINVDFIGSDELFDPERMGRKGVRFLNFRGDQDPKSPLAEKISRVLRYYGKLIRYALVSDSKIFHIIWLNKFVYFDRTLLNVYYKILGKKLVHTAHNINQGERDGNNSLLNRWTLKIMYELMNHIFVHTKKMKEQLCREFSVPEGKVTVIPFGINNTIPITGMTPLEAREHLGLRENDKVLLFFGNIAAYKGLETLIHALVDVRTRYPEIRLIIAGRVKGEELYWRLIQKEISKNNLEPIILEKIEFIPDDQVEIYYRAADLSILPYRHIFQSGVLFLSYAFGLPVVATDVGSLREDILEGRTGFVCRPDDPSDLAEKIYRYFRSDLYGKLPGNRSDIVRIANEKYSWDKVGEITFDVYQKLA